MPLHIIAAGRGVVLAELFDGVRRLPVSAGTDCPNTAPLMATVAVVVMHPLVATTMTPATIHATTEMTPRCILHLRLDQAGCSLAKAHVQHLVEPPRDHE